MTAETVGFYASVQKSAGPTAQTALLLGPHDTYEQADADRAEARRLAEMVDDRAVWYAYGVSKVTSPPGDPLPVGKLNHLRGVADPDEFRARVVAYRHDS